MIEANLFDIEGVWFRRMLLENYRPEIRVAEVRAGPFTWSGIPSNDPVSVHHRERVFCNVSFRVENREQIVWIECPEDEIGTPHWMPSAAVASAVALSVSRIAARLFALMFARPMPALSSVA